MPFLNRLLEGGLPAGKLIGLVGPSGGGKTLLALQTAFTMAYHPGHPVLYINLEPGNNLPERLHALTEEYDLEENVRKLIPGALCQTTLKLKDVDDWPRNVHVDAILASVEELDPKPVLLVIDQLEHLVHQDDGTPKKNRIEHCCKTLREYAHQSGVTILLLHQRDPTLHASDPSRLSTIQDAADIPNTEELVDIGLFIGNMDEDQCCYISRPETEVHEKVWLDGDHNRFRDSVYLQTQTSAPLEFNWEAVYSYFMPEIVTVYKELYTALRNEPHFYVPDSQQPYELDTDRYDDAFWEEVFQEHWLHGGSLEDTWMVFMGSHGCGGSPWPDMMKRAPKIFSYKGLYRKNDRWLLGAFRHRTSDADIQKVFAEVEKGGHNDNTLLLTFLMTPDRWTRLTEPDVRLHVAHYLEQFLSVGAAQELESKLGAHIKPFFDWIATSPSRDPQP